MTDPIDLTALRQLSWEQAKAQLATLLGFYVSDPVKHADLDTAINTFVTDVETNIQP